MQCNFKLAYVFISDLDSNPDPDLYISGSDRIRIHTTVYKSCETASDFHRILLTGSGGQSYSYSAPKLRN